MPERFRYDGNANRIPCTEIGLADARQIVERRGGIPTIISENTCSPNFVVQLSFAPVLAPEVRLDK
jgi:hypothetical protein